MDGPSYVTFVFHVPVFGAVLELLQDFVCVPYDARSCAQLLQHLADQTGLQPSHLATASLWYRTTPTMVPIECTDKTVVDLASGALQGARLEVIVECGGDCMAHVDWQLRAEVMAAQMRASGTVSTAQFLTAFGVSKDRYAGSTTVHDLPSLRVVVVMALWIRALLRDRATDEGDLSRDVLRVVDSMSHTQVLCEVAHTLLCNHVWNVTLLSAMSPDTPWPFAERLRIQSKCPLVATAAQCLTLAQRAASGGDLECAMAALRALVYAHRYSVIPRTRDDARSVASAPKVDLATEGATFENLATFLHVVTTCMDLCKAPDGGAVAVASRSAVRLAAYVTQILVNELTVTTDDSRRRQQVIYGHAKDVLLETDVLPFLVAVAHAPEAQVKACGATRDLHALVTTGVQDKTLGGARDEGYVCGGFIGPLLQTLMRVVMDFTIQRTHRVARLVAGMAGREVSAHPRWMHAALRACGMHTWGEVAIMAHPRGGTCSCVAPAVGDAARREGEEEEERLKDTTPVDDPIPAMLRCPLCDTPLFRESEAVTAWTRALWPAAASAASAASKASLVAGTGTGAGAGAGAGAASALAL